MISRKKNLSLIFLLTILTGSSIAQTNVSGGIYTNTTWTLAGSPYIVVDTVVVFPGVTLTIDPGVIVKFANGKYMEIRQASIMAVGNSTDSITFTSNSTFPTLGIWGKVWRSGGNMVCNFNYCNFKYSSQGIYGADTVKNSSFVFNGFGCVAHYLDSCSFRNNGTAARGDVYNSIIRNNQTGVSFGFNVKNCQIDSNQTGLDGSHTLIENSSLSYNQVGGTSSQYESNIYKNCVINYNTVKGVALMASNEDSVINCEIGRAHV